MAFEHILGGVCLDFDLCGARIHDYRDGLYLPAVTAGRGVGAVPTWHGCDAFARPKTHLLKSLRVELTKT